MSPWWQQSRQEALCLTSHCCERNISSTPWGNVFKYGANVHLDSTLNWLEFGVQMSKFKVTGPSWRPALVSAISQERITGMSLNLVLWLEDEVIRIWTIDMTITIECGLKLSDRVNWWGYDIWCQKGQRLTSLPHHSNRTGALMPLVNISLGS